MEPKKEEPTGIELIAQLREAVQPRGKKPSWMRQLTDRQLVEVYHRLKLGQPAGRIVKIVQNEWGIMRTSSSKSLTRAVRSFRDKVVGELVSVITKGTKQEVEVSQKLQTEAKKIGGKINVLGSMAWLIEVQLERVHLLFEREKVSLPFKHTDVTVKTACELISNYMEMCKSFGILEEIPKEFNVKVKHEFDEAMRDVIGSDSNKVVNAIGRFIDMAKSKSMVMKKDETGTYHLARDGDSDERPGSAAESSD